MKFQFSGHDSFICKHFWLKKGFDFLVKEGNFNNENAVIELGVGKNMVSAINYWLKAFGIIDSENNLSSLANFLFDDKIGKDKYIENIGTIWLLHYQLVRTNKASLYSLFFNEFNKKRIEFSKDQIVSFVKRKYDEQELGGFNQNTVYNDVNVFVRNYHKPNLFDGKIDVEEDFSGLLMDLNLLSFMERKKDDNDKTIEIYKVENGNRTDLPFEIVLLSIIENSNYGNSISFKELLHGKNSPGNIFCINEEGLFEKIKQITEQFSNIVYSESEGIQELQFKVKPNNWDILNGYYKN